MFVLSTALSATTSIRSPDPGALLHAPNTWGLNLLVYNGMCVVFWQAHRLGMRFLVQPQLFPLFKYWEIHLSCFLQAIDSLLLLKHGSQSWFIPHLLRFLAPSLRLLSFPTLRFISVLIHVAWNCWCMRQGDGPCSDVMMVKHACSKQRVSFFVKLHTKERGKK